MEGDKEQMSKKVRIFFSVMDSKFPYQPSAFTYFRIPCRIKLILGGSRPKNHVRREEAQCISTPPLPLQSAH